MRKLFRFATAVLSVCVMSMMGLTGYFQQALPDSYSVHPGQSLSIHPLISAKEKTTGQAISASKTKASDTTAELDLFGIIPIKQAHVSEVDEIKLIPCGTPFGIKLLTQGVMVVGLNNIDTEEGLKNPARDAGLKIGDIITAVNGQPVSSNREISSVVSQATGDIEISYTRGEQEHCLSVTPVVARTDHKRKIGVWVRDSSAGIGTVTFYDPEHQIFGGLGHAVCDVDTGMVLPISYGEIVPATISGVNKGAVGQPGELIGAFTTDQPMGNVLLNTESGVFGDLYQAPTDAEAIPMALKQEVHTGKATILSTLNGTEPKEYEIEIEDLNLNSDAATKNMVIRVTDQELLDSAGGIVQGMSGSPILQDGKLVGAVTHVFVNNPTKGYGIFAENMEVTALSLEEQQDQKAS